MKLKKTTFIWGIICLIFSAQIHRTFSQETPIEPTNFITVVENILLSRRPIKIINGQQIVVDNAVTPKLDNVCPIKTDATAKRIFQEYGAIFVSRGTILPRQCIFDTELDIQSTQNQSMRQSANIGGVQIMLQKPAMEALLKAIQEAAKKKLKISPRGGSLAAGRSYQDTVGLWNSRFYPALNYWVGRRKISRQEADDARALPIRRQVAQVLEWENKGLFFSKDLSKSILFSVAAPGASQHNFLLALDVEQFANKEVRKILAENGWFQTVLSDLPHFTYLGVKETELPALGLKPMLLGNRTFWIPNIVEPTTKLEVKKK